MGKYETDMYPIGAPNHYLGTNISDALIQTVYEIQYSKKIFNRKTEDSFHKHTLPEEICPCSQLEFELWF